MKKVIVVVPCYNEELSIEPFMAAFDKVYKTLEHKYGIALVLINDGSTDRTQEAIESLRRSYPYVCYRQFVHNSGHQSALRAGLDVAQDYDAAIMMDADLQHPPKYIPTMLKEWESTEANIVQMLRKDSRKETGIFKYWSSRGYYWLINRLADLNLQYGSSDFRLVDKTVLDVIARSPETYLFLRGYFAWLPVRRCVLEYKPDRRIAGESKYTLRKMLDLAHEGILQFSEKPLRLAMNLGSIVAASAFLYGVLLAFYHLTNHKAVSGWTSLMDVMLFCFGINFILLGFIGRYLAHSIALQKKRPEYLILKQDIPEK